MQHRRCFACHTLLIGKRLRKAQSTTGITKMLSSLEIRRAFTMQIQHILSVVLIVGAMTPVSTLASVEKSETDLLIVGGTESGWAAALRAARLGVSSITIVHDGEWLGGQFTEQALACVDENKGVGQVGWGVDWHPMKRSFHRSGLFKELMDRIETFNEKKYGSPMPGRPHHGPSTFRPAEAEAIFREMLQPYLDSGQVRFVTNHYPVRADYVSANIVRRFPKLTGLFFFYLVV